jgi:uncharacterized protein (DUF433 family)
VTDKKRITNEIPVSDDVCIDQEHRGGHPRVGKGRFPVSQVLAELVDGEDDWGTIKALADDYGYPVEEFVAALRWAAQVLDQDFTRTNVDLGVILEETWVVKDKTTGWWWRPDACGYTQELLAAGAVDEDEARSWATRRSPDGRGYYTDEVRRVDEDGCCVSCGTDVFHDEEGNPMNGRDRKIAELKQGLEDAKAAAEEIRDVWVPKEKHTEFPWES